MITLIENYPTIKGSYPSLLDTAKARVEEARATNLPILCPYLSSSRTCGIYNHRPVACKIWSSADLQLCINNMSRGYPPGINALPDASNKLRDAFEAPFEQCIQKIVPDMNFRDKHDCLEIFEEIAMLDKSALLETLKQKIDSGELNEWRPFD